MDAGHAASVHEGVPEFGGLDLAWGGEGHGAHQRQAGHPAVGLGVYSITCDRGVPALRPRTHA